LYNSSCILVSNELDLFDIVELKSARMPAKIEGFALINA